MPTASRRLASNTAKRRRCRERSTTSLLAASPTKADLAGAVAELKAEIAKVDGKVDAMNEKFETQGRYVFPSARGDRRARPLQRRITALRQWTRPGRLQVAPSPPTQPRSRRKESRSPTPFGPAARAFRYLASLRAAPGQHPVLRLPRRHEGGARLPRPRAARDGCVAAEVGLCGRTPCRPCRDPPISSPLSPSCQMEKSQRPRARDPVSMGGGQRG